MADSDFRKYIPDLNTPRFQKMQKQDAHEYAHAFKTEVNVPWLHALWEFWLELLQEPYKGVTSDGTVQPNLYSLQDEEIPIHDIVAAANQLLSLLTPTQTAQLCYHIDSPEWRSWSNPEILLKNKGLRLDEIPPATRDAILTVLRLTLSPEGYAKAVAAMRINHFLGELVAAPAVMNEFSYNFVLFGHPSATSPWGFSFYGHHLCLNVFLHRAQLIIAPWFTGAEPNHIDSGPYAGTRILHVEESLGLQLMQSLSPAHQALAQTYPTLDVSCLPPGRWNPDDQRHLCGAYRDNRVVPYEGLPCHLLSPAQLSLLTALLTQYLLYLPLASRTRYLDLIHAHLPTTHFSWIGGLTAADAFYFRVQSPVVLVEFDHHTGVFLANETPAKFHVHTLLRMPNGGDYGMALRPLIPGREQGFVWRGGEGDGDGGKIDRVNGVHGGH